MTAFIRFWDEKLNAKTIPSGEIDGIRILSIHKSKGLEYHTVLLPFCDWKMENKTNNHLIWCSVAGTGKETDIPPFNRLDIVPVNYSGAMAESVYHDDYLEEKLQALGGQPEPALRSVHTRLQEPDYFRKGGTEGHGFRTVVRQSAPHAGSGTAAGTGESGRRCSGRIRGGSARRTMRRKQANPTGCHRPARECP